MKKTIDKMIERTKRKAEKAQLISEIMARFGRKGGKARSAAKVASSRANGKLGGRPTKPVKELSRSGKWRRAKREAAKND